MKGENLILNFSDIYTRGGLTETLLQRGEKFRLADLSSVPGTSCYLDPQARAEILSATAPVSEHFRWIDTGDYHYVSVLFSSLCDRPFTLLLFDNHPDDQTPSFEGVLSCGSWVLEAENNPLCRRIVREGPDGRFDPLDFSPSENIYISIDLDVLSTDCVLTDWSQGEWTLKDLKSALDYVAASGAGILAVDICGGLSESKGATGESDRINLACYLELFDYFKHNFKPRYVCC